MGRQDADAFHARAVGSRAGYAKVEHDVGSFALARRLQLTNTDYSQDTAISRALQI